MIQREINLVSINIHFLFSDFFFKKIVEIFI